MSQSVYVCGRSVSVCAFIGRWQRIFKRYAAALRARVRADDDSKLLEQLKALDASIEQFSKTN